MRDWGGPGSAQHAPELLSSFKMHKARGKGRAGHPSLAQPLPHPSLKLKQRPLCIQAHKLFLKFTYS